MSDLGPVDGCLCTECEIKRKRGVPPRGPIPVLPETENLNAVYRTLATGAEYARIQGSHETGRWVEVRDKLPRFDEQAVKDQVAHWKKELDETELSLVALRTITNPPPRVVGHLESEVWCRDENEKMLSWWISKARELGIHLGEIM